MVLLGLLLAGLGVAALVGSFDSDDDTADIQPSSNDDDTLPIQRDGEPGLLIEGGELPDVLYGTDGHDIVSGEGGDDSIRGRDGLDVLIGGEGSDSLFGQTGQDELAGGNGDDELHGGRDDDNLYGEAGNDTLYGGPGNDQLIGADITNRPIEVGDYYSDRGTSGPYAFEEPTSPESNELHGGDGDDLLILGEGDVASGDAGSDTFVVGHWVDGTGDAPLVTDFNTSEDAVEVIYLEGDPAPTITLGTAAGETQVFADGELVLRVQGDGGPASPSDVVISAITLT